MRGPRSMHSQPAGSGRIPNQLPLSCSFPHRRFRGNRNLGELLDAGALVDCQGGRRWQGHNRCSHRRWEGRRSPNTIAYRCRCPGQRARTQAAHISAKRRAIRALCPRCGSDGLPVEDDASRRACGRDAGQRAREPPCSPQGDRGTTRDERPDGRRPPQPCLRQGPGGVLHRAGPSCLDRWRSPVEGSERSVTPLPGLRPVARIHRTWCRQYVATALGVSWLRQLCI